MTTLNDCVAVVTGASRGAGRGIAVELGAAGATVYVTGRSRRGHPAQTYDRLLGLSSLKELPGNIETTADEVTRAGGRVLIGDEAVAPWLKGTEFEGIVTTNNPLFKADAPLYADRKSTRLNSSH